MLNACLRSLLWFLFSFRGRAARLSFFCYQAFMMPFVLGYYLSLQWLKAGDHPVSLQVAVLLFGCFLVWAGAAVMVKRLHDLNLSGWWALGLPFLSALSHYLFWSLLVVLALLPGRDAGNRFGPKPAPAPQFLKMRRIDALNRDFAQGRIDAARFNARRAEILGEG